MKTYKLKVNDKEYKVDIESVSDSKADVFCNDKRYEVLFEEVSVKTKTPVISRKAAIPLQDTPKTNRNPKNVSINTITAPIPGLITEIAVSTGDSVKGGQIVAKMEAMKMENNILASADGKIESISVKVGDSVLEGDVLMEMGDA